MDRNYAAPGRQPGATSALASARGGLRTALVVVFVGLLLFQIWALYLYVPSPTGAPAIPHADKVVHALLFAAPAAVAVMAGLRTWLVVVILVVHAPLSELAQHRFLVGRAGDPWDAVADVVGVAVGLAVGLFAVRKAGRESSREAVKESGVAR